tara:strand:+ start:345 stop:1013 length:669 start_codon:yes stop_codon:yes gene_type:complete
MSRQAKIIIFGAILAYSIYSHQNDSSIFDWTTEPTKTNKRIGDEIINTQKEIENTNNTKPSKSDTDFEQYKEKPGSIISSPQPKNGFSPYNAHFGKGIYNNSAGNVFIIKNSNDTDAVVLLVDAYSGRKVRNEYVRKGASFEMTGVPNGTYYLEWASGINWSPQLKVGKLTGGFQTKASFTKTRDRNDWMSVDGYRQWTVTLYSVSGGDVESESLSANEFGN